MDLLTAKRRVLFSCLLALVYIGLPLLLLFGVIDFNYKFYALTVGAIIVYAIGKMFKLSNAEMGITISGTKRSIIYILPLTIVLAIVGIIMWISGFSRITPNESWTFFIFYIFISSPVQEFLYRGVLEAAFLKFKMPYIVRMIVVSALYSFVHIIYRDFLTLVLTFVIGVIWFACYQKPKNLIGVSISHAVLGFVTIVAGIIN
ncbi:MAG: CPBP family intramembrane metalloprotease [Oscillospiraceae bacterium]|jgi:membrane protease YdiL (CAAX protease family)|nr:CPBP family intramembrane metalloprotease [Oscillospiraceae bacterium]